MAKNTQTFNGDIAFVNASASGELSAQSLIAGQFVQSGLSFSLNQSEDGYIVGAEAGASFGNFLLLPDYYNGLPVVGIASNGFNAKTFVHIRLPQYLQAIGTQAFSLCTNLVDVELPETITVVGTQAFKGCAALEKITIKALTPPTFGTQAFNSIDANAKLYVPAASVTAYRSASTGLQSANIIAIEVLGIAEEAVKAYNDENGDDIVSTYAKQNGVYANMTVGAATWAANATNATNATNTDFTNQTTWTTTALDSSTGGFGGFPSAGVYEVEYIPTADVYVQLGIVRAISENDVYFSTTALYGGKLYYLSCYGLSALVRATTLSDASDALIKTGSIHYRKIR